MNEIKKAIAGTLGFIVCVVLITFAIVNPYYKYYMLGYQSYQDAPIRKELASSLDFLVVGASQAVRAFDTEVLDEKLDVNSYNLALPLMTMDSRYFMLNKELDRNNAKTVVIEISYDVLQDERSERGPEGILRTLGNLDSYSERLNFFFSSALLKEYGQLYYQSLEYGIKSWGRILKNNMPDFSVEDTKKGYRGLGSTDVTLSEDEFFDSYHTSRISENFVDENCSYLEKMIRVSQAHGARVILCIVPVSEGRIISRINNNILDDYLKNLANIYNCEFYNFNLLKDRAVLFPASTAFYDAGHMSSSGAESFTSLLCDVMVSNNPNDFFWETYEDAELNGTYREYLIDN